MDWSPIALTDIRSQCLEPHAIQTHLLLLASCTSVLLLAARPAQSATRTRNNAAIGIELAAVLLRLALDALLLLHAPDDDSTQPPSLTSLTFWSYLLLLLSMRGRSASVWCHSSTLYALRWLISAATLLSAFRFPQPLNDFYQTASFLLECVLLIIVACTPVSTVAIRDPNGTHPDGLVYQKRVTVLDLVTFSWLTKLVWTGYKKPLQAKDVWLLSPEDMAAQTLRDFSRPSHTHSLTWRLLRSFRNELLLQALWACLSSVTVFMPTLLLQAILQYLVEAKGTTQNVVWPLVILMFVSGCVSATAEGQMVWLGQKIAIRLRSIIIGEVYAKAMSKRTAASGHSATQSTSDKDDPGAGRATPTSDATIFNLIAVDSFKIADAGTTAHELWASVPIQIIICLALLYRVLGFSALAGVAMMVVMFPINTYIINRLGEAQMNVMGCTDLRIRGTTEFLRNIRVVEFFAWEQKFIAQISEERSAELRALKVRLILWSIAATIWYVVPLLITFLSFVVYVTVAGTVGSVCRHASTSTRFPRLPQSSQETGKYEQIDSAPPSPDAAAAKSIISLKDATFSWTPKPVTASGIPQHTPTITLRGITANFKPNNLNVVAGPVGSGKSSLLLALLGEMNLLDGTFRGPAGPVAYCAQEAWLVNASIRDNILFTQPWEPERYKDVIKACALDSDFKALDAGDLSLAGDRGIFLSSGQKQRIALARAVYSQSLYLLIDDCLSAVDSQTARWIFNQCLTGRLMKDRTCILATHNVALVMSRCAYIVFLEGGRVRSFGRPDEVGVSAILGELSSNHSKNMDHVKSAANKAKEQENRQPEETKQDPAEQTNTYQTETAAESDTLRRVSWRIIAVYIHAMGTWRFWILFVFLFVSQQIISTSAHWWIKDFSNAYSKHPIQPNQGGTPDTQNPTVVPNGSSPHVNIGYYLGIYGLILCLYTIVSFSRMLLVSIGSLSASKVLHDNLLISISHSTLSYFDKVPFGRLLNRFSKDIQACDLEVAPMALATVHFSFALLSIVTLITTVTSAFLLPGLVITLIYLAIGRLYIDCSRDLKRLEAEQRDPLYQHFSESISGIATIRAFRKEQYFTQENLKRVDAVNTPYLYLNGVDRWLAFRLSLAGSLISFFAVCFAIVSRDHVDAGTLIRYYAASEQSFTSLERIHACFGVEQEPAAEIADSDPLEPWPDRGEIIFDDYSTTYRADFPFVLKSITFRINPTEKVGVVGRTGAGKSSLVRSLLRGLEASSGKILIDGVDISSVGLRRLRQGVVVVSQDATLFATTLRSNLDPLGEFSDEEIHNALQRVQLVQPRDQGEDHGVAAGTESYTPCDPPAHESISQKTNFEDLSFMLAESGSNISQGQRQLLCLARAILRAPKVLVLDEATSLVDYDTDMAIQRTIAEVEATIITIAHRLQTVIDYDKVLMLDHGEIKAFDHPWVLLQQCGIFKEMCQATGNFEMLEGLAKAAWEAKQGS